MPILDSESFLYLDELEALVLCDVVVVVVLVDVSNMFPNDISVCVISTLSTHSPFGALLWFPEHCVAAILKMLCSNPDPDLIEVCTGCP